jgi:hypothetical protein
MCSFLIFWSAFWEWTITKKKPRQTSGWECSIYSWSCVMGSRILTRKQKREGKKAPAPETWALITIPGQLYVYTIYLFILSLGFLHIIACCSWIQFIHINSRQSVSLFLSSVQCSHTPSQLLVSVAHSYLLFITFQKTGRFSLSRNPSASGYYSIGWASFDF